MANELSFGHKRIVLPEYVIDSYRKQIVIAKKDDFRGHIFSLNPLYCHSPPACISGSYCIRKTTNK